MQDEGIVYKRVFQDKENPKCIILYSDNEEYAPYTVKISEVVEMWGFACSITMDEPNSQVPTIAQVITPLKKLEVSFH